MNRSKKKIITFNQIPVADGSAGGGNNWSNQFIKYLKKRKYQINYKLSKETSCIFINNSKSFFFEKDLIYFLKKKNYYFNYKDLAKFKKKYPKIPIIHRINDTDAHRKSNFIDSNMMKISAISDFSIFVSNWIKEYYFKKGIIVKKFKIIRNIANPKIFNLNKKTFWKKNTIFKIVTHHWSNNLAKGFHRYQALDSIIEKKKIKNINFFIIGNTPKNITWKICKIINPISGKKLATKLKSFHGYIAGSRYEASAFHIAEALQCGLPIIYFKDGGSAKEQINNRYGLMSNDKEILNNISILKKKYFLFVKNLKKYNYTIVKKNKMMLDSYLKVISKYATNDNIYL